MNILLKILLFVTISVGFALFWFFLKTPIYVMLGTILGLILYFSAEILEKLDNLEVKQ